MEESQPPELGSGVEDSIEEKQLGGGVDSDPGLKGSEGAVADVSGKTWEVYLFEQSPSDPGPEGLYVYRNKFHLLPRAVAKLERLKTLKFFANEIEVLPPESGDLVDLERLQVKVSSPGISSLPFQKFKSLKELELCRVPPKLSVFSILSEISRLECLTKLSVCHFSIQYLPPEIGSLKKLEDLDLSFNKLKRLPNDIAQLSSLRSLNVSNNKLVDLPPGISSLGALETLDLSHNRLTSLTSLNLPSMLTLQLLDIQYNKLPRCCRIPSWISYSFEGNVENMSKDEASTSIVAVDMHGGVQKAHWHRSCIDLYGTSSSLHHEASSNFRCHSTQRMKREGWKWHRRIQQRARQDRINYSRNWKDDDSAECMTMVEESCVTQESVEHENSLDNYEEVYSVSHDSSTIIDNKCDLVIVCPLSVLDTSSDTKKAGLHKRSYADHSCSASEFTNPNNDADNQASEEDNACLPCPVAKLDIPDGSSSSEATKVMSKTKRLSDKDLDNPKPSKSRKPVDNWLNLSCKYSSTSFCGIDDRLPDGFYDAGRDRPFKSLEEYEQSLCLDSREVILLDREKDDELDAIVFSAQLLMSTLKRSSLSCLDNNVVDELHRASVLALFVSDCFGGSERGSSVMRTRRAVLGLNKQQPFVCTCSSGEIHRKDEITKQLYRSIRNLNLTDLCEKSLHLIKESRSSSVVPIGSLRFGVCRHRAVLMKYLCDRESPPLPCELVRGYLDFMPHAWNAICVKRGSSWVRLVVDACYPTDIREETDSEYFCRYIPLSCLHGPVLNEELSSACSFFSSLFNQETESKLSHSVFHYRYGKVDVAIKVNSLKVSTASDEEIREFEYKFLGEVRMLRALKEHNSIINIYGHHLSYKWIQETEKEQKQRILQSIIVMEHVKGGSLKNYLSQLSDKGEKHAPVDIALHVARAVACALVEVHNKQIIHRDVKSANILIDLDQNYADEGPLVKLCDFDRSVPLYSYAHTCCIAHLGVHPPDVCVGTPRWMAPEVIQAMHQRNPYSLEVDIWSYGCLLLELLTLQVPFQGLSESDIYDILQRKQRPRLTPDFEALAALDDPRKRFKSGMYSDADAKVLKLLVDIFYKCTKGNPADRPSARQIYDWLCAVSLETDSESCDQKQ